MGEVLLFDEPVPADVEVFCARQAEVIRVLGKRVRQDIIEIGQRLIEVHQVKSGAGWLLWLKNEFEWTDQTARNYMRVATAFGEQFKTVLNLQIDATALFVLAGPYVPQSIRNDAIEAAEAGEHITKAKAEGMVAEAVEKAKRSTAEEKERQFREAVAEAQIGEAERVQAAIDEATKRLAFDNNALTAEIADIKRRKPEIQTIRRDLCRILDRKDLTIDQWRWLAQILGETISNGKRSFQPLSKEQIAANEENLRIASAITGAFETLAGAPPAAAVKAATWPVQRKQHRRTGPQIIMWLTEYMSILGEDE
jgi:hypothetical protein